MGKYILHATVPKANREMTKTAQLSDEDEALWMAKDLAWELYMAEEGVEGLPSYQQLYNEYYEDGGYYSVKSLIDDLYVRTIDANIDYWIEEVIE